MVMRVVYQPSMNVMLAKTMREKVQRLEAEILKAPQIDAQTTHAMSGGMYARTIFIPKGTVLTGATHKTDHINIMDGDIEVSTDEGMKRLTGHHVLPTKAGMKRVGYALADTWWTTICKTDLSDIHAIEDELVVEADQLQTRRGIGFDSIKKVEG